MKHELKTIITYYLYYKGSTLIFDDLTFNKFEIKFLKLKPFDY